ncbi:MAG: prealbumin-like fold domain-containing protein, partial [Arcanobacterium sp.]|nr:prealbumin-like fold domain-containing protein [Arcanobacterium sp.]
MIVLRVAIALSAVCAIFVGFFAPVALAEPAAPRSGVSADHGLLLLTSTGEILRMAEDGSISPAEPYLPALIPARVFPNTDSTTFIKKPITTAKRQLGTSRWDHGSLDDPQNWYQITGISYNALGNASDGTLYAMLRVTSHTRQINGVVYRGLYRAYRLTPGDTYWQPYGADFYLPADTVPPESQQPQPITAGAVSPIDNKYYFGSAVQDPWDQQTYFHLYRMEPQNGSSSSADATPVYVGKSLIRPAYNSEGQPISSAAGDISFTSDGSLVIGASVHDRDGEQSLVRMQVIRRDVLAAAENRLGGELSAFYLPTIATLYRTGEYYSASYDENKVEEASGFATLADGSLITSHKGNLGHSYLLKATYDWRNATTPGSEGAVSLPSKIFAKIDDSELASETLPSPFDQRKCVNFAPIGDAGWTDMNSYARCYIGQDGRTWLRSQQLFNTVVVDMAGSMEWMPSVKLKKDVTNRRISDSDQFKLAITAGRADLTFDEVTTSGTATGVQTASAGPIPVAAGTTLTFSETITSSTNLHQYRPQFSCVDGNGKSFAVEPTVTESKASASVTVPEDTANGIDLTCTFTNKAIVTHNLKVIKVDSTHENGAEQLPPLGGAQLRLWKDKDGNGQLDENVDTLARAESTVPVLDQSNDSLTTGKTGLALWKGLESGKYLVEEVNAPHGYKESAPLAVTIADKDVEVVLKNT